MEDELQCDDDKYKITIEPVYFNKTRMKFKTLAKCVFYGTFYAIMFVFYLKILSSPVLAMLYSIGTAILFAASVTPAMVPISSGI